MTKRVIRSAFAKATVDEMRENKLKWSKATSRTDLYKVERASGLKCKRKRKCNLNLLQKKAEAKAE